MHLTIERPVAIVLLIVFAALALCKPKPRALSRPIPVPPQFDASEQMHRVGQEVKETIIERFNQKAGSNVQR